MKTTLLKTVLVGSALALTTTMSAFTAVTSGLWSSAATWGGIAPGANVSNADIIIPAGITVDLDLDVTYSAATIVFTFTVDGTLNNSNAHTLNINLGDLEGAGTIAINRLVFNGLATSAPITGTINVNILRNTVAALSIFAEVSVSDSLHLAAGILTIGTGGNITMLTNSNVRRDAGSITTGGGNFTNSNPYHVWYIGTSKTTGIEADAPNSLSDLHIVMSDNMQVITAGNAITVNGTMYLVTGQYSIGALLTLNDNLDQSAGTVFNSTSTSDLTVNGTGPMATDFLFSAGSSMNNLTIQRPGGTVGLASALSMATTGTVWLTSGDISVNTGGDLIMNAGTLVRVVAGVILLNGGTFTGTAAYNVRYVGGSIMSGVELSGSGVNNVRVDLNNTTDGVTLDTTRTINGLMDMRKGKLRLNGFNLTLNGTLDQVVDAPFHGDSTSQMILNLTASVDDSIWFGPNGEELDRFVLNIPSASTITLVSQLTVISELAMTSGKLALYNNNLTISPTASITNADDTRYIVTLGSGYLAMTVNQNSAYVIYPIGTDTYGPAKIQQTAAGSTAIFLVRAMDGVWTNGTTGSNATINQSVVDRTWLIDTDTSSVTVDMNLKLGWQTVEEVNSFNRNVAYIAHYYNGVWDNVAPSAAVVGSFNTYEITRSGITSLSPFVVADTSAAIGVSENGFNAFVSVYPNPSADVITVSLANNNNEVFKYEIFDATGKLVMTVSNSNQQNKFDLSKFSKGSYFLKITNSNSAFVTKRVVKS